MKHFFKVTILSAIYTFIKMIAGFIIGKVVAVYTGPSGIAMLGQVQSFINIAIGITTAPVGNGVVRYTAENWDKGENACAPWWSASLRIAICILAIIFPISIFSSKVISNLLFNDGQYQWVIILSTCIMPLSVMNILIASVINGQKKYKQFISLGMLSVVISTALMILLVILFKLNGALIATSLYTATSGIVLILFCINKSWFRIRYWFLTIEREKVVALLKYTLMALVSAASMPFALLLVRKILINQVGWIDAGNWQAVWKISEVYLGVITIALSTYLLPHLSLLKDSKLIRLEINKLSLYLIPVVVVLAASVYALRDIFITILFTKEFYDARELFLYQLIGDVFKIAGFLYAYPLISQGRTAIFITLEIIFSVLIVFLSYYFIGENGVQGANIAYMSSYIFYFFFSFMFTNLINIKLYDDNHVKK